MFVKNTVCFEIQEWCSPVCSMKIDCFFAKSTQIFETLLQASFNAFVRKKRGHVCLSTRVEVFKKRRETVAHFPSMVDKFHYNDSGAVRSCYTASIQQKLCGWKAITVCIWWDSKDNSVVSFYEVAYRDKTVGHLGVEYRDIRDNENIWCTMLIMDV